MPYEAQAVVEALGGRWTGSGGVCRCPAHDDRNPSLSVSDGDDGRPLLHCHAGCSFEDVLTELKHMGVLDGGYCSVPPRRDPVLAAAKPKPTKRSTGERALEIWRSAASLSDRSGSRTYPPYLRYLRRRCISDPPPAALRQGDVWHSKAVGRLPAMVAAATNRDNQFVAAHITFLSRDASSKAKVDPPRKIYGRAVGGSVRLAPVASEMAVAEGIETALSFMQMTGIPTWSALSSKGLERLDLPQEVRSVMIAADRDESGAGENAAKEARRRWASEGRKVEIVLPHQPFGDFNDQLQAWGGRHAA